MAVDELRRLPMFPLGNVVLPGQVLPLQVFEPRYDRLVRDSLAEDRRFGTVLIERGSEVGGGDQRRSVGTVVSIVEAEPVAPGRWHVVGVGAARLRVVEWLPDDPYPQAMVTGFVVADPDQRTSILLAEASAIVRAWLSRAHTLGLPVAPADLELPDDPIAASELLVLVSPLGPLDRQAVVECADPSSRLEALLEGMDGQIELLDARFGRSDDWRGD